MNTVEIREAAPVNIGHGSESRPAAKHRLRRFGSALVGWSWRLVVGGFLCFTGFLLSFLTSIAVVGWTYRWMQTTVLRGWWKKSRLRDQQSYAEFCDTLGNNAPVPRPRWLLQERIGAALSAPTPLGNKPGAIRRALRLMRVPWHSLWLNFKLGVQGLFCTYLLTGWGCLIMLVSWEFGWLNSFNKGYEQAFTGPLTGILGVLLFILAMFYVPMAQVHQAATGEARAFFHFRFIWQLIRARITAYVGLAALILLASIVLEIARVIVLSDDFPGNSAATDEEGLTFLYRYFQACGFGLFLTLFLLRGLTAVIYRSAVLKALRLGWVQRDELHPLLTDWLERLDMMPVVVPASPGLVEAVRVTTRWSYRRFLYAALFLIWLGFVIKFYAGYFLVANGIVGFLNHQLVQFPCFDFVPQYLLQ